MSLNKDRNLIHLHDTGNIVVRDEIVSHPLAQVGRGIKFPLANNTH